MHRAIDFLIKAFGIVAAITLPMLMASALVVSLKPIAGGLVFISVFIALAFFVLLSIELKVWLLFRFGKEIDS